MLSLAAGHRAAWQVLQWNSLHTKATVQFILTLSNHSTSVDSHWSLSHWWHETEPNEGRMTPLPPWQCDGPLKEEPIKRKRREG